MKFPEYRRYEEVRLDVNTAVMALLAGSRLASHTLALTDGSQHTLGEIFPAVEHIRRFNLRSDVARQYLTAADDHLAAMAITYVLAVHEDFVVSMNEFAKNSGMTVKRSRDLRASNMHLALFTALASQPNAEAVECFHLLRLVRNSIVHAGRKAQTQLINYIPQLSKPAIREWRRLNNQLPSDVVQNGKVVLIASHIFSALAFTKRLDQDINAALANALPSTAWAEICVQDYRSKTTMTRNSVGWKRELVKFSRSRYGPVQLSSAELEVAAKQTGAWTIFNWP